MLATISITHKILSIFVRYVLPGLAIAGGVAFLAFESYQKGDRNGADRVTLEWQKDIIARMAERDEEMEALRKRSLEMQRVNERNNKQLEERHNEKIQKLNSSIVKLRNRGLYVTATACSDSGTGEAKGTGVGGKTPNRIRLSEEDEGSLIRIAEDAQGVVAQYETCRERLSGIAEIVPDINALPWLGEQPQ